MRNAYINAMYDLAEANKNILALVADNGAIVYDKYKEDFPAQFINFGISEANMVSTAAGLARCGKIPFAYTIAGFITMRAYEQIRDDVCLQEQNVKLVGVGAGVAYGALGPTHHCIEDIAIMRVLPGMTVLCPATPKEAYKATVAAAEINGPVYIRLEATKEPEIYEKDYEFIIGKAIMLEDGHDATIVATGSIVFDCLQVVKQLKEEGISVRLINMHTIKPLDNDIIIKAAKETGVIISVEEHSIIGGLGSAVSEVILESGHGNVKFSRIGFNDKFCKGYGTHNYVKDINGLSVDKIKNRIKEILHSK
ncbi:MAG: transketolase family protein [Bacillota bacterium]